MKGALKARVFYEGGLSDAPDHRIRIRAAEVVLKLARIFESDGAAQLPSQGFEECLDWLADLPVPIRQ